MTDELGRPGGDASAPATDPGAARADPVDARANPVRSFRPTFVVWLTIGVTAFALLIAVWMYWIGGAVLGTPT